GGGDTCYFSVATDCQPSCDFHSASPDSGPWLRPKGGRQLQTREVIDRDEAASRVRGGSPSEHRGMTRGRHVVFLAWRDLANSDAGGSEILVDRLARGRVGGGGPGGGRCGGGGGGRPRGVGRPGGARTPVTRGPALA